MTYEEQKVQPNLVTPKSKANLQTKDFKIDKLIKEDSFVNIYKVHLVEEASTAYIMKCYSKAELLERKNIPSLQNEHKILTTFDQKHPFLTNLEVAFQS